MIIKVDGMKISCDTQSDRVRAILLSMSRNPETLAEEREALSFADSCVKTLKDMGVIE